MGVFHIRQSFQLKIRVWIDHGHCRKRIVDGRSDVEASPADPEASVGGSLKKGNHRSVKKDPGAKREPIAEGACREGAGLLPGNQILCRGWSRGHPTG